MYFKAYCVWFTRLGFECIRLDHGLVMHESALDTFFTSFLTSLNISAKFINLVLDVPIQVFRAPRFKNGNDFRGKSLSGLMSKYAEWNMELV